MLKIGLDFLGNTLVSSIFQRGTSSLTNHLPLLISLHLYNKITWCFDVFQKVQLLFFQINFYRSTGMKFCYLCRVALEVQRMFKTHHFVSTGMNIIWFPRDVSFGLYVLLCKTVPHWALCHSFTRQKVRCMMTSSCWWDCWLLPNRLFSSWILPAFPSQGVLRYFCPAQIPGRKLLAI